MVFSRVWCLAWSCAQDIYRMNKRMNETAVAFPKRRQTGKGLWGLWDVGFRAAARHRPSAPRVPTSPCSPPGPLAVSHSPEGGPLRSWRLREPYTKPTVALRDQDGSWGAGREWESTGLLSVRENILNYKSSIYFCWMDLVISETKTKKGPYPPREW